MPGFARATRGQAARGGAAERVGWSQVSGKSGHQAVVLCLRAVRDVVLPGGPSRRLPGQKRTASASGLRAVRSLGLNQ